MSQRGDGKQERFGSQSKGVDNVGPPPDIVAVFHNYLYICC